jgi:hypothetical protein
MIDPLSLTALASATLTFLAHHSPWLADKVGAPLLSQAVRETWNLVKKKLTSTHEGNEVLNRLQAEPSSQPSPTALESLKATLLDSLHSDPDFATQLSRLVVTNSDNQVTIGAIGSDNQITIGTNNKEAKVTGSTDVSITIS